MKCSSLAPDGSDFAISPAVSVINGATGIGCDNGFDMDSVILTLRSPCLPEIIPITVKNGTDAKYFAG